VNHFLSLRVKIIAAIHSDAVQNDHTATRRRKNYLPKDAQEIYKEAFNSAAEQYDEESRAHRVALSAAEQKYEKNEKGNWVK
jgi:cation transport regulator